MVAENLKLIIKAEISAALAKLKQLQQETEKTKKSFDFSKLSAGMVKAGKVMSIGITAPIVAAGTAAVKAAADLEMQQAAFETMLGSAEAATDMIEDLRTMAAKTPFGLKDLADASKTMLGFGIEAKNVLPYLRQIGDVSGGNAQRFASMALAFSQIQATGRLMGQDLLQLINAGFNPLQTISEQTGESMIDLKQRMEKGGVSAEEIARAFASATEEGGRFFGGMARASETLSGQLSTLKDDLIMLGIELVKELMPVLKEIVANVSAAVKWFQNLDDGTKSTITKVLGLAAAMGPLLIVGGKTIQGVSKMSDMFNKLGNMLGLTGGQMALITLAVVALAAAVFLIIKNWGPITDFFKGLWDKVVSIFNTSIEWIVSTVTKLWDGIVSIFNRSVDAVVSTVISLKDRALQFLVDSFWGAYQSIKTIIEQIRVWVVDKLNAIVSPIKDVADKISGVFAALKEKLVGHSIVPDMVDRIEEEMVRMNKALANPEGVEKLRENIQAAAESAQWMVTQMSPFADAVGAAMMGSKDAAEMFKEAMKGAAAKILEMIALEAFARAAMAAVPGPTFNPVAAGAYLAAGTGALVAAGAIKALAEGGIVTRPTMALVGERGPEAVIPLNKAGGMGPTVIVNVQGSVLEEEGLARRIAKVVGGVARGY